jgi:hypothetical protein
MKTTVLEAPPEMVNEVRELGQIIGDSLPPGVGFMLVLFNAGEQGWSTYCANGRRADMAPFLRELAGQLERTS